MVIKRVICKSIAWLLILILIGPVSTKQLFAEENGHINGEKDSFTQALDDFIDMTKYDAYLAQYSSSNRPQGSIIIEAKDYSSIEGMEPLLVADYEGLSGQALLTGEKGNVTYTVNIEADGLYNLGITYYPVEGKSSAIQRGIFIDGELPFAEMQNVEFDRIWANEEVTFTQDNQGNDLKPSQIEKPRWIDATIEDYQGYYSEPFQFFLTKGTHEITLVSRREPLLLKELRIYQENKIPTYDMVSEQYKSMGYKNVTDKMIVVEAEQASSKSSQMLYPVVDHSSPAVTPYSASLNKNNTIGGNNWRIAGQWIEWEVSVPESGLYKLGFNVKQNFIRGIYASRKLTIDGAVPFKEMEEIPFEYDKGWRQQVLGNETEPYLYYLSEGTHTIRMEVVLGQLSAVIREAETGVRNLNTIYRQVLSITGTSPDQYRDYQIQSSLPKLEEALTVERDRITKMLDDLKAIAGDIGDREAGLVTLRDQLNHIIKDIETFPRRLNQYKQNIGSLGTWMIKASEQPLQLDQIYVGGVKDKLPNLHNHWWDSLIHELKALFYSFIINYNAIGNVSTQKDQKTITVWVGTGRDQANVMKSLIDEEFTKSTGINVNLMLVDMGTLLPATLSGQGPDVAMQIGNDLPMNYGMRNAVADISKFEGFQALKQEFYPSAFVPYEFDGKVFAVPEQQTFNMLFYRKDILNDLGLEVPKTWDDVKVALSVLSKNQMGFGMLPSGYTALNVGMIPVSDAIYGMFLYQNGGTFYENDAKKSGLDSDPAINAFKEFTEFYTDYKLEREFDIVNRFRTGEMPLVISDYTTYNTLQVSAPEIKGLWGFAPIPGTVLDDGSIDDTNPSYGTACIMMEQSKDKEAAWEFMKWWVSSDIQTQYGREMEGLMGPAARYPTANKVAFANLPWPVEDYEALAAQFETVEGIPQVPGGYFTQRHLNNAFYQVVVSGNVAPREALTDFVRYINDEITYKRSEFELPTIDEGEDDAN